MRQSECHQDRNHIVEPENCKRQGREGWKRQRTLGIAGASEAQLRNTVKDQARQKVSLELRMSSGSCCPQAHLPLLTTPVSQVRGLQAGESVHTHDVHVCMEPRKAPGTEVTQQ